MKKYIGIADCHGVESFIPLDKEVNQFHLMLRATSNPQRAAIVYKATFTEKQVKEIKALLDQGLFIIALEYIKGAQELGKLKNMEISQGRKGFYDKIPNPKLDPYHKGDKKNA